ncbi:hypothetical protein T06_7544 [Trichinella sp. T6]|nr:hypothetical protein T06_7544 [Trichinella sp. T6]
MLGNFLVYRKQKNPTRCNGKDFDYPLRDASPSFPFF